MPEYTDDYALLKLGVGDTLATDSYKFGTADRDTIARLLRIGAELHRHDGAAAPASSLDVGARSLTLTLAQDAGGIPAGVRAHYVFTLMVDGLESAISDVYYVDTPSPIVAPAAATLATAATGGTLLPGSYYYMLTAYTTVNTDETKGLNAATINVPSGTATNAVTLTLPGVPDGATGFNVYRKQPGGVRYDYLTSIDMTVATPPDEFVDDGTILEDCNRTLPAINYTNRQNHVTVDLAGAALDPGVTWRLYRTYADGDYLDSRIASVTSGTTFDDLGAAGSGSPPSAAIEVPSPSKIILTAGAEVQGLLPSTMIDGTFVGMFQTVDRPDAALHVGEVLWDIDLELFMVSGGATPTWAAMDVGGGAAAAVVTARIASTTSSVEEQALADYLCDGTADDVQFQAAIDAVMALVDNGDTARLLVSRGSYDFSGEVGIGTGLASGNRYVLIECSDPEARFTIERSGTSGSIFEVTTNYVTLSLKRASIYDFAVAANADPLIKLRTPEARFQDCVLQNDQGNAVEGTTGATMSVKAKSSSFSAFGGGSAIYGSGGFPFIDLTDCKIIGETGGYGIELLSVVSGGAFIRLTDCDFRGGVRLDGSTGTLPRLQIEGGRCTSSFETAAVHASDCAWVKINGLRIQGSTSAGTENIIHLDNVDAGQISDVQINNARRHGIYLNNCDNIAISDCMILDPGQETDDTYSGIFLDGDTNGCFIHGCLIRSTSANKTLYGIRVDDATCDNNTITNNDLRGASKTTGNEFSDAGTGTITSLVAYPVTVDWMVPGEVIAGTGLGTWRCPYEHLVLEAVSLNLSPDSAPASDDIIVDVNKYDAQAATPAWGTIFTTQASRPTVPVGVFAGSPAAPQVIDLYEGDYLSYDVDQDGGGATPTDIDLTVQVFGWAR